MGVRTLLVFSLLWGAMASAVEYHIDWRDLDVESGDPVALKCAAHLEMLAGGGKLGSGRSWSLLDFEVPSPKPGARAFELRGKDPIGLFLNAIHYTAVDIGNQILLEDGRLAPKLPFDDFQKAEEALPVINVNRHYDRFRRLALGQEEGPYSAEFEVDLIHGPGMPMSEDPRERARLDFRLATQNGPLKWLKGYRRQKVRVKMRGEVRAGEPALYLEIDAR